MFRFLAHHSIGSVTLDMTARDSVFTYYQSGIITCNPQGKENIGFSVLLGIITPRNYYTPFPGSPCRHWNRLRNLSFTESELTLAACKIQRGDSRGVKKSVIQSLSYEDCPAAGVYHYCVFSVRMALMAGAERLLSHAA